MSLKVVGKILDSARIDGLEDVARSVGAVSTQEDFPKKFATKIIKDKIVNSKKQGVELAFQDYSGFPFGVSFNGALYLVDFSEAIINKDNRKSSLLELSRKLGNKMEDLPFSSEGLVYFMSYLINGKTPTEVLARSLPITFANLAYDARSLERRAGQYSKKQEKFC